LPALVVLSLAAFMYLGVPAIDAAVPDGVRARAGDEMALARGITFVPAAGWVIADGTVVSQKPRAGGYPSTATVTDGPVSFRVQTAPYPGSATSLLERIKKTDNALYRGRGLHFTGDSRPVRTSSGERGVVSRFRGTSSDGAIAAFVIHGTGVKVVVTGPPRADRDPAHEIDDMLASIREGSAGGTP
jgi:hypothetical protein